MAARDASKAWLGSWQVIVLVSVLGLGLVIASYWVGHAHGMRKTNTPSIDKPSTNVSYDSFRDMATTFQQQFHPPGFTLLYPVDKLPNEFVFFPPMQFDARGIAAVDGDATRPSRYDLFYYADPGVLFQLSIIYAPWSEREEVIYMSVLMDQQIRDFPPEYREKVDLPYVLQELIGQRGYFLQFTAIAADHTLPEEEAMKRVGLTYESFLKALDDFIASNKS